MRLLPVLCLAVFLPACRRDSTSTFRVVLLSPGPVSDQGWNAAAYEGLQRIEKELHASVSQQEVLDVSRHEPTFRRLASDGVDLILGHGAEFLKTALLVAGDFPKTAFLVSAGSGSSRNVASVIWRIEDAAYLAGFLGAKLSRTKKLGFVGGFQYQIVESVYFAYEAGARRVDPGFDVRNNYIQSWSDLLAGRAATEAMIAQGVDVVFHDADHAGLAVLRTAGNRKILAFGCMKDQADVAPDAVLASVAADVPRSLVMLAREVKEKRFYGRVVEHTRADGIVSLTYNPRLEGKIPGELRAEVDALDRQIARGELKVPYDGKAR